LFSAAIDHARHGFAVTHGYAHFATENRTILEREPGSRQIFLDPATGPAIHPYQARAQRGAAIVDRDAAIELAADA
jgi:gamma-glutamyltranspeptidase